MVEQSIKQSFSMSDDKQTSSDTCMRLLDAAEDLFAELGFQGTSLRKVTQLAGVNLALVNYHFGSKNDLILAMIRRRVEPVNQERLAMLEAARRKAGDEPIPLEDIVRAFFQPKIKLSVTDVHPNIRFFQIVAHMIALPKELQQRIQLEFFQEIVDIFLQEFQKTFPDMLLKDLKLRLYCTIGLMIGVVAKMGAIMKDPDLSNNSMDFDDIIDGMCDFVCAGFRSPIKE